MYTALIKNFNKDQKSSKLFTANIQNKKYIMTISEFYPIHVLDLSVHHILVISENKQQKTKQNV